MLDKLIHKNLKVPYSLYLNIMRKGRNPKATIILLHGLASTSELWKALYPNLPKDTTVIAVDLLGHGKSPKPSWLGAQTLTHQARALKRALQSSGHLKHPIFIVGHSMGSLIAAEFARLYPKKVDYIVLVSPPIYLPDDKTIWPRREKLLKKNYEFLINNKGIATKVAKIATTKFINGATQVLTDEDFEPLVESLKLSILEQDTFEVLKHLNTPTKIIYGAFDPLVIGKNITKLKKYNDNISITMIPSAHDVTMIASRFITKSINQELLIGDKNE